MDFQGPGKVKADFDGGQLSSEGDSLLVSEADSHLGIVDRLAACFTDHRNQDAIEHRVYKPLRQRFFGLALGYGDLNDHDSLRRDVLLGLVSGKKDIDGTGEACPPRENSG